MRTRRIGRLEVSVVGLGGNNFGTGFFGSRCDQGQVTRIIRSGLDAGVTFIDTAEEYSVSSRIGVGRSEEFIGAALGSRRDEAVIATKFQSWNLERPDELGAERIVRAAEDSLRRLGTDRIDLYQQHRPDPATPIEEILEALDRLVRDGKVLEIGCCNFSSDMIDEAQAASGAAGLGALATSQSNYSLLEGPTPPDVIEACERHGMGLIPYFPLANGVLTGKYRRGETPPPDLRLGAGGRVSERFRGPALSDERFDLVEKFEAFARDRGHSLLELAISWLVSQPVVTSVIAGATRPEQVEMNAAAASWELSSDDFHSVATIISSNRRVAPLFSQATSSAAS